MRSKVLAIAWLLAAGSLFPAVAAADNVLSVPLKGQEKSNWCWNGCSSMVLDFYGHTGISQTIIAEYAVAGFNKTNYLSADGVSFTEGGKSYKAYGCKQILKQFGPVQSTFLNRSLSKDEVEKEMDGSRPAILAILWTKKKGESTQTVGGHAVVLAGKTGDKVTLNDPWPANNSPALDNPGVKYLVDYDALFNAPSDGTYTGSANVGNTWGQTLKTGRALDICFLIDSTGSMSDDIANVKAAATGLVNDLAKDYKDLRIAVVDYRDYPANPWGSTTDYITKVRLAFADDTTPAQAVSAIQSITVGGGADWPEAVYSAVMRCLQGTEIGAWRKDAERRIILMGDAPGHNPEPWTGGYSFKDVIDFATTQTEPVSVYSLGIGSDSVAAADLSSIAAATGGGFYAVSGASAVAGAIEDIIEEFTEDPRAPKGDVVSIRPLFSFTLPQETMNPEAKKHFLVMEKFDEKKGKWKNYKKIKLPGGDVENYLSKSLPIQTYRWRLGFLREDGTFTLPSGEATEVKGGYFEEGEWTEFDRLTVLPADPNPLAPGAAFTATDESKVVYRVGTSANATKYVVEIYKQGNSKPWRKFTLKPPKADPNADFVEKTVGGHKAGVEYWWRTQSLNYDRKKPVGDAWVYGGSSAVQYESPDGQRSNVRR